MKISLLLPTPKSLRPLWRNLLPNPRFDLLLLLLLSLATASFAQKNANQDENFLKNHLPFLDKAPAAQRPINAAGRPPGDVEECDGIDNNGDGAIDEFPDYSGNVFLKGHYLEVGVAPCGSFGSNVAAPAGYHPRGGTNHPLLGFVADLGKDGWGVGSPVFCGDYFVPGTPEEGFGLTIGGSNYNNNLLCGTSGIPGGIANNSVCPEINLLWTGAVAGLGIQQYVHFPNDKIWWIVEVTLTNNTASTMNNIYYHRNVDPDQDQPLTGNYSTTNTIVSQNPNAQNLALVTAVGTTSCYLALGSLDPRSRVTHGGFTNRSAANIWNGVGFFTSGTNYDDTAISLAFKIETLAPGESTTLKYAYMLDGGDIEEALEGTSPFYPDNDGDGFGDATAAPVFAATAPAGHVDNSLDCDDSDPDRFPGNIESCDGVDNDCLNGIPANEADFDGDGYRICDDDCNDNNAAIHPGRPEICNSIDDDCDGQVDEGAGIFYYADMDSDGFGDPDDSQKSCTPPVGHVTNNDDCNDEEAGINPAAAEICGNGIDENCNGMFDDICGGGGATCDLNLLINAGFEDGLASWAVVNAQATQTNVHSGANAARICSGQGQAFQNKPAIAGESYTASVWAAATGGGTRKVALRYLNSANVILANHEQNVPLNMPLTQFTMAGTAPAGTAWVQVFWTKSNGSGCIYTDDWCLSLAYCGPVPSGWTSQDIGFPGLPGATCFDGIRWTGIGSGEGIGGTEDECQFGWTALTGNGSISAKIERSTPYTNPASGGIMMRASLDDDAANIAHVVSAGTTKRQYRSATGGNTTSTAATGAPEKWLRISRINNNFRYWTSTDGITWTFKQLVTIPGMPTTMFVGLAVGSNDDDIYNSTVYSNVSVQTASPMPGNVEDRGADAGLQAEMAAIFPNPAQNEAWLQLNGQQATAAANIRIRNAYGQEVRTLQSPATAGGLLRLDLTGWPQGVYSLEISGEGIERQALKLVINGTR